MFFLGMSLRMDLFMAGNGYKRVVTSFQVNLGVRHQLAIAESFRLEKTSSDHLVHPSIQLSAQ